MLAQFPGGSQFPHSPHRRKAHVGMRTDIVCGIGRFAANNVGALDAARVVVAASLVGVRASVLLAFVLSLRGVEDLTGGGVEGPGQVDQLEDVDLPCAAE